MSDREEILRRIRSATADVPRTGAPAWCRDEDDDPAVDYRRTTSMSVPELTKLFVQRCREYTATVSICAGTPTAIAAGIGTVARRRGATTLAIPHDLDASWQAPGLSILGDDPRIEPLSLAQLNTSDGVLTGCELAIADTGTIVLNAGPSQGRRALSLIPDLHICVVRDTQIVARMPDAIAALAPSFAAGAPVTFISGPSATSDIELNRVEGVHGPRQLEVIVAGSFSPSSSSGGLREETRSEG